MERINIATLAPYFSDEEAAWELVEKMRWNGKPVCPHCGSDEKAYFIAARSGCRTTKKGTTSYRRLWKCSHCRKQFSVLVGTIFEDTKVPLAKWLMAIYMMCADKNGVAGYELHRTLGVTNKTAWHMNHRIREAMKRGPLADMLRGTIVADETFIGPDPKRMNKKRAAALGMDDTPARRQVGWGHKTAVLTLINQETGESRSRVVANVTGATLYKVVAEQVDIAGSVLHTDGGKQYRSMGLEFMDHQWVDHKAGEYVKYVGQVPVTTNDAEGFFGQLKRSIDGTHHHVSVEHLDRYLAEFDHRYSTRKMDDGQRMADLMTRTGGKRLTYRKVAESV